MPQAESAKEEKSVRALIVAPTSVVGNWVPRHHLWQNPFLNAPLPYENVTGLWDASTPASVVTLLNWAKLGPTAGPSDPYPARLQVPVMVC